MGVANTGTYTKQNGSVCHYWMVILQFEDTFDIIYEYTVAMQ